MLAGRHGDEDRTLSFDPTSFAWLEGIREILLTSKLHCSPPQRPERSAAVSSSVRERSSFSHLWRFGFSRNTHILRITALSARATLCGSHSHSARFTAIQKWSNEKHTLALKLLRQKYS